MERRWRRLGMLAGTLRAPTAAAAVPGATSPTIGTARAAELEQRMGGRSFLFRNDGGDRYTVEAPPRFELGPASDGAAALAFLDAQGFVVVRAAAGRAELAALRTLLWAELESLGRGIRRAEPATWHSFPDAPFAQSTVGLYVGQGLGQSELLWTARALPGVRYLVPF
jgi:hypothetical protein